ncbi:MAG: hypothetical protein PHY66_08230 [Aliarcobacter sp.]|nr:hypothetical protein [Aliarcobacter sp.]MDD2887777.1 hypothetical protein [Aliarcobacter sp.]
MQYPTTIIELDNYFTEENRKKFLKIMNENFDIEEKNIEIYQARNYSNESEFASEIYAQIFREMKEEY